MDLQQALQEYQAGRLSLDQMRQLIASSPEQAQYLAQQQELQNRGERTAVATELLDTLKNIGFTATALRQISKARGLGGQLAQPSTPQVPGLSPELSQAIYEAQRGVSASPAIAAATQGINDAYNAAISQGRELSGGQAGANQALAQLANIERMKAQLGLAPIAQQVQMQNQANLNNLVGTRVDERQQQYLNSLYGAQLAQQQYEQNAAAVGGLGQAGYTNLFNTANALTNNLQNLAPYGAQVQFPSGNSQSFRDWVEGSRSDDDWFDAQTSSFDKEMQDYMKEVRDRNISNNPYYNYSGYHNPQAGYFMGRPKLPS